VAQAGLPASWAWALSAHAQIVQQVLLAEGAAFLGEQRAGFEPVQQIEQHLAIAWRQCLQQVVAARACWPRALALICEWASCSNPLRSCWSWRALSCSAVVLWLISLLAIQRPSVGVRRAINPSWSGLSAQLAYLGENHAMNALNTVEYMHNLVYRQKPPLH
jgi:hypothetical protein